jgi:DNA-binding MarR family transcriptional regulator
VGVTRAALDDREAAADQIAREAHLNVLIAAGRFTDEMDQICRTEGLTGQQFSVLWVICLHEDSARGIPMRAIADGLVNRASDTTRLIDRLLEGGLVTRAPSETDRRVVLVRPTAKGRRILARLVPNMRDFHRREWSALSKTELRELNRLLAKALWGDE